MMKAVLMLLLICLATPVYSFIATGMAPALRARGCHARPSRLGLRMAIEQIEYIIHRDGRVEEKVTGIKGKECLEVTKEVEKALGKVVYNAPTAEQFEEKVTVTQAEVAKETVPKWTQY